MEMCCRMLIHSFVKNGEGFSKLLTASSKSNFFDFLYFFLNFLREKENFQGVLMFISLSLASGAKRSIALLLPTLGILYSIILYQILVKQYKCICKTLQSKPRNYRFGG